VTEPLVLRPGEGTSLQLADVALTFKATSAETGGVYSLIEGVWQPSGFGPLPHIHTEQEESFYVLEGEFDFLIGEDKLRAEPGTFLVVPRGVLHAFAAANAPGRLMFMHTPPLEGFFFELADLMKGGPADPSEIRTVMGRWGMEAPAL
jgi:quercetin dioxygenase-like cupin family protein